jgi:hypothetical protein
MSLSRSRLIPFFGSFAAVAALFVATPALAANAHAAPAARSAKIQAELKAKIRAELRHNPSGKVINARQISYDHGNVIVTIAIPGVATVCPSGYACLYDLARLRGDIATIQYPEQKNISIRGYLPDVESLWNRRGNGSILSNGQSSAVCYPSGATANSISPPVSNYPYLWLEANSNC